MLWTCLRLGLYLRRVMKGTSSLEASTALAYIGTILQDGEITQAEWMSLGHRLGILHVPTRGGK